jgi:predicted  nucleic acid-binding Zn-ribbon protein
VEIQPEVLKRSIESLLKLQEIDAQLFQIETEEGQLPAPHLEMQTKLNEAQKAFQTAERGHRDFERERRSLELRTMTLAEDLKRSEAKRRDVRNTKEEFAANKEFENFQKKVAETQKLFEEKTELVNQKSKIKEEKQQLFSTIQAEMKKLDEARAARLSDLKSLKQKLSSQRDEYITKVDELVFSMYERIQKLRKGSGIAIVKNSICMGCHVALPPQMVLRLDKLAEIITCPSCSRILFPSDGLGSASAAA